MASRDSNHATVVGWFEEEGASVRDLWAKGDSGPDILVGYAGLDQLVEIKDPGEIPPSRSSRPSSRCKECGKTYPMHQKRPERTCGDFQIAYVKKVREAKESKDQKRFRREWRGREPRLARTREDVRTILAAMRVEANALEAIRAAARFTGIQPREERAET